MKPFTVLTNSWTAMGAKRGYHIPDQVSSPASLSRSLQVFLVLQNRPTVLRRHLDDAHALDVDCLELHLTVFLNGHTAVHMEALS